MIIQNFINRNHPAKGIPRIYPGSWEGKLLKLTDKSKHKNIKQINGK